ncbi:hypothetical protein ACFSLT_28940 [Novosphingobium resinovorum]
MLAGAGLTTLTCRLIVQCRYCCDVPVPIDEPSSALKTVLALLAMAASDAIAAGAAR